jgi:hypothetical protein
MASIAERTATRRAAASQAEGKIKKTLEEMSGWSASSSEGSSDVCRLSDFADLPGDSRKKARKESSEEETKTAESEASSKESASAKDSVESEAKDASSKSNDEASSKPSASSKDSAKSEGLASTESNEHKDTESATTTSPPSPSPPSPSYSSSTCTLDTSPEPNTEERARQYRQQRADARNQHSNGPMLLSRRLSWKLAKAEPSPNFSPITAKSLAFTPSTTITKSGDRTH